MAEVISDLEKFFRRQKEKFYNRINAMKTDKLKKHKIVSREFDKLKKHEQELSAKERAVSAQLSKLKRLIQNSIEKEHRDKIKIKQDIEEIKRMRKELPRLKAIVKVSRVEKEKIFGKEKILSNELNKLHQEVLKKGLQKEKLEQMLREFNNKERLLMSGKIYWHAPAKAAKKTRKSVSKIVRRRSARRKSIVSQLFGR